MPNNREAFEAAYAKEYPYTCQIVAMVFEHDGENYTRTSTRIGWRMWQAGAQHERSACIQICADACSPLPDNWGDGYNQGAIDCETKIRDRSAL